MAHRGTYPKDLREKRQSVAGYDYGPLTYVWGVERGQIPTNRSLIFIVHLPRSFENGHQDGRAEWKSDPPFSARVLDAEYLASPDAPLPNSLTSFRAGSFQSSSVR
jgi:hypothetical protein